MVPVRVSCENGLWFVVVDGIEQLPASDPWAIEVMFRVHVFGLKIDDKEYRYLVAMRDWAQRHDPSHPAANPTAAIKPNQLKPLEVHPDE